MSDDEGRVFLRGLSSLKYGLGEVRRRWLDAPRVRGEDVVIASTVGHDSVSADSRVWWRLGPGDEPFLTQTIQVHFVEIAPGKANKGHGHQNEAAFLILQGKGYEIHDGQRYDWEEGDFVAVHTDSRHQHFNDGTEPAVALVVKAKSMWMYFGLIQQGSGGPIQDEGFGPREDWSRIWTPGVEGRRKVVKSEDVPWDWTGDGRIRKLAFPGDDFRLFSLDVYQQEIPAGGRSSRHWHMADEVLYVLSGAGNSVHWEVRAEIDDRYYAHVASTPTQHAFKAGDLVHIPTNTVHQHFNSSTDEPLVFLSVQNRLFRYLGYDTVAVLEDAPRP